MIAAGGFFDGRGLAAALSYGAAGVAMGTRFLLTSGSTVPDAVKQRYLQAGLDGTVVTTRVGGMPHRVLRTGLVEKLERCSRARGFTAALRNAATFKRMSQMTWASMVRGGLAMRHGKELTWSQVVMADNTPMLLKAGLVEGNTDAGLDLTRAGGPDALTVREATRRVGVSPNAAYRHFADREALLRAVVAAIQLRMAARMQGSMRGRGSTGLQARDRLRAVGMGYIRFALDEPGWFTTAFFGSADGPNATTIAPPFVALIEALDAMTDAGVLPPERRDGAEWPCWSAVHGFAELALHGPLRGASRREVELLAGRTVDDIIAGLSR